MARNKAAKSRGGQPGHGFNLVSVQIAHEAAPVLRAVVRARAGRAVIRAACGQGGGVKSLHLLRRSGQKSHVHAIGRLRGESSPLQCSCRFLSLHFHER